MIPDPNVPGLWIIPNHIEFHAIFHGAYQPIVEQVADASKMIDKPSKEDSSQQEARQLHHPE